MFAGQSRCLRPGEPVLSSQTASRLTVRVPCARRYRAAESSGGGGGGRGRTAFHAHCWQPPHQLPLPMRNRCCPEGPFLGSIDTGKGSFYARDAGRKVLTCIGTLRWLQREGLGLSARVVQMLEPAITDGRAGQKGQGKDSQLSQYAYGTVQSVATHPAHPRACSNGKPARRLRISNTSWNCLVHAATLQLSTRLHSPRK